MTDDAVDAFVNIHQFLVVLGIIAIQKVSQLDSLL